MSRRLKERGAVLFSSCFLLAHLHLELNYHSSNSSSYSFEDSLSVCVLIAYSLPSTKLDLACVIALQDVSEKSGSSSSSRSST